MLKNKDKKKKTLLVCMIVIIILLVVSGIMLIVSSFLENQKNKSTLFLQTDADLTAMSQEEFYVDIKLSDFPEDGVYSASSFVLNFDSSKLEFKQLRLGTMSVSDENGGNLNSPMWECNSNISNKKSSISAMYIDMTASDKSYRANGYAKATKDVLMRAEFVLKDSAVKGDELKFSFDDAVLASIDKEQSLSMVDKTLTAKDYSIKVN